MEPRLKLFHYFIILGSVLSSDVPLDNEINSRLSKLFSKLKSKVWQNANLSKHTKLAVFSATVIFYGTETRHTTAYLIRHINSFLLGCLRQALSINPLFLILLFLQDPTSNMPLLLFP